MSNRFFKPLKKGEIHYKLDYEGMFQEIHSSTAIDGVRQIELMCKISMARSLDDLAVNGIYTSRVS